MTPFALLVATATVSCSCGPEIPGNPIRDAPPRADEAVGIVWAAYETHFARDLGDPPPIAWVTGPCLDISLPDECTKGLHTEPADRVWLVYVDRPHQSWMTHEFLHSVLFRLDGSGDPDHEDAQWPLADDIKTMLRNEGL